MRDEQQGQRQGMPSGEGEAASSDGGSVRDATSGAMSGAMSGAATGGIGASGAGQPKSAQAGSVGGMRPADVRAPRETDPRVGAQPRPPMRPQMRPQMQTRMDNRMQRTASVSAHADTRPFPTISTASTAQHAPAAMAPDALDELDGLDELDSIDGLDGIDGPDALPPADLTDEAQRAIWLRVRARKLIREFLRAVPRTEPEATLALVRPDGTTRIIKRAELSAAIDRLRPRQRQILRLGVEERWPRARVCEYLHNISMKTFERDQVEGLDILMQL